MQPPTEMKIPNKQKAEEGIANNEEDLLSLWQKKKGEKVFTKITAFKCNESPCIITVAMN